MSGNATNCGYTIRAAGAGDIPKIRAMQERSIWTLGSAFYNSTEIANFLAAFGTMDDAIVVEGHFFVAEDDRREILGSGGWSRSRPGYAAALGTSGGADMPTVRSVFVDPAAARRGVGSAIMSRVEQDATEHGIRSLRLTATLSGVPLYIKLGYRMEQATEIEFPDRTHFGCVKMAKALATL